MSAIRVTLLLLTTTLLGGCYFLGGSSPQTRFYALEVAPDLPVHERAGKVRIGVGPVRIPDSLQRPQIVTRTDDYERSYADFDHWAGSLETNLLRVLGGSLMEQVPAAEVQLHPWPHTREIDYQARIDVLRMDGARGEYARLQGTITWVDMSARREIAFERFDLRAAPENGSYRALVGAWSALANQLGEQLAARAASLPAP